MQQNNKAIIIIEIILKINICKQKYIKGIPLNSELVISQLETLHRKAFLHR